MHIQKIYNDLPISVKEDIGFPINSMSLTREQELFLETLLSDILLDRKEIVTDFKDELEELIDDT